MKLAQDDRPGRRSVTILGIQIDDVTIDDAVQRVIEWAGSAAGRRVVTPNPEMVMAARRLPPFASVLNESDLAVPDGVGLWWASRLLGTPLRATVPGVDLVEALGPKAAILRHRWYLLGAAPGVAAQAGRVLARRHPGLVIVGAEAGDPRPAADAAVIDRIRAAGPVNLLLVAYGAPAQEIWLARNLATSGASVGIGVGGTFNFLAGRSARPPAHVQHIGLGWLYRLATEPWRWRRQLALPRFAMLVAIEAAARQVNRRPQR
jgi:N-acetylglucosaminyldiphosphoundecaprenol N-acetyl-beta-D-mannosaminyltransferase